MATPRPTAPSNPAALGEDGPGPRFQHPTEREFARLLDFYRIAWDYEPTAFPLVWSGDRVTEAFRPDFYLPERDLYVELTTMSQRLLVRKHRKLRRLRELHPDVQIALVTRRDFADLLARFGYGAVEITSLPAADIERILASPAEIAARVAALGARISADYAGRSLVLVGLLKGVTFFLADLARAITRPLAIDYLSVARPQSGEAASDRVRFVRDLDIDIRGKHVLLIEDIVNTGLTLDYVVRRLREREPASLETCVLFDKRARRLVDVPVRYTGFDIPDAFVVGYGLDDRELYRNLPFLCVLRSTNKSPVTSHEPRAER
ncbi:MAG: hypoxanthine phosphoribosyltransferase [Thermomicrobiales bacterium]|nr:hypoxanthine phosphoribosyltransferase [Thermomicrobiales bacterium]